METSIVLAVNSTQVASASAALEKMAAAGSRAGSASAGLAKAAADQSKALTAVGAAASKSSLSFKDLTSAQAVLGPSVAKQIGAGADGLASTATNAGNAASAMRNLGREAELAGAKTKSAFASTAVQPQRANVGANLGFGRTALEVAAVGKATKDANSSIDEYVRRLQTTVATNGMSARQTKLYELSLRGASKAQLDAADSAIKLDDAYKRGQAIGDRMRVGLLAVGAAAVTAAGAAVFALDSLLKKAGAFQDMGEKIGDTAENVASLAVAAGTAGKSMEEITSFSIKLAKNLTGVDEESSKAGIALKSIGIDLNTFKNLQAADQLEAIAKALAKFDDTGSGKTSALESIARGGAQLLPFLRELGQEGGRQVILTAEQIKAADAYADAQGKLRTQIGLYAGAIATQFIEPTNALLVVARNAIRELNGTGEAVTSLGVNRGVQQFAEAAGRSIASFLDYVRTTVKELQALGDFATSFATVTKQLVALDIAGAKKTGAEFRARQGLDDDGKKIQAVNGKAAGESYVDAYNTALANSKKAAAAEAIDAKAGKPVDTRQKLPVQEKIKKERVTGGGGGKSAAETAAERMRRAALDSDLKEFRDALQKERDALSFHNRFLQGEYQAGNVSLRAFYDEKRSAMESSIEAEIALLDREKARIQQDIGTVAKKDPAEAQRMQASISEIDSQQSKIRTDAARDAVLSVQEQTAATKQLSDAVTDYRINLMQMQGDEEGAARARAAQAIEQAQSLAKRSGGQISPAQINALKQAQDGAIAVQKAQTETSRINEQLQNEEDRIAIKRQSGALSEYAALAAVGDARAGVVAQLKSQITVQERVLATQPENQELIANIERARLEVEKLEAAVDPLKAKFDDLFENAGANAIEDFITGAKSAKDALRGFGKEIFADLTRTAAQDLSKQLFSAGGLLGDAGGLFASVLGPKKGAAAPLSVETAGITSSLSALQTAGIDPTAVSLSGLRTSGIDPTTAALTRLQQATDSAAMSIINNPRGAQIDASGLFKKYSGTSSDPSAANYENESDKGSAPMMFKDSAEQAGVLSTALVGARNDTKEFSSVVGQAVPLISSMAGAGAKANAALSLLPSIISAISSAAAVSSATGTDSNWFGTLLSLAGAASGSGSGMATNTTGTNLPTSGGRALGGPAIARARYLVGEKGPEILRMGSGSRAMPPARRATGGAVGASIEYLVGESGPEILLMGSRAGVVIPNNKIDPAIYSAQRAMGGPARTNHWGKEGGPEALSVSGKQYLTIVASHGSAISGERAMGGQVSAGKRYRVNEAGPEVLNVDGKQYLMMGSKPGSVTANKGGKTERPISINQTFILDQPASKATQSQVATQAFRGAQRGVARGNA